MKITIKILEIVIGILFSTHAGANCYNTINQFQNQAAMQGGSLNYYQMQIFQQQCTQELMNGMNPGGGGYGAVSSCNSGIYAGQNVHHDRCLAGNLLEGVIGKLFQ